MSSRNHPEKASVYVAGAALLFLPWSPLGAVLRMLRPSP